MFFSFLFICCDKTECCVRVENGENTRGNISIDMHELFYEKFSKLIYSNRYTFLFVHRARVYVFLQLDSIPQNIKELLVPRTRKLFHINICDTLQISVCLLYLYTIWEFIDEDYLCLKRRE